MYTILKTDQYKFAMAEAGWPLREETFYYSHRKNGPHLMPVDVKEYIKNLFTDWRQDPLKIAEAIRRVSGLQVGDWMRKIAALHGPYSLLTIKSVPKGSWFPDKAPAFTVTGPSFLVSWLEPQVLQLNYRIQIATLAARFPEKLQEEIRKVTCEDQKNIILETLNSLKEFGFDKDFSGLEINVCPDEYVDFVHDKVNNLLEVLEGDYTRMFEVGFRAASCLRHHELSVLALGLSDARWPRKSPATSNTHAADLLGIKAVGTMGHEHVQRFGSDTSAYNAMAERLGGNIFCLLDTFDTINSGLPAAFKLIGKDTSRQHAIRFDSGDILEQFRTAHKMAIEQNIEPIYCFEDGWNLERTKEFEKVRKEFNLPAKQVVYGYGGYLVNSPFTTLTRDRVAAVWKLCQTGDVPVMKFTTSKESIPGKPVLWFDANTKTCYVYQDDELASESSDSHVMLNAFNGYVINYDRFPLTTLVMSKESQNLIKSLNRDNNK